MIKKLLILFAVIAGTLLSVHAQVGLELINKVVENKIVSC